MSPDPGETDEKLWQRMRSGDEAAFLLIYRKMQGGIFRFALHMSGSDAVAEDVTQEVFLVLIRNQAAYDPAQGTISGYLYGIARKQVLRHLERERGGVSLDNEDDADLPLEAPQGDLLVDLTHRETLDSLRQAIATLPSRYREVVVLCDLEELDYLEAAAALGCAVGTVRSRLHRARQLLASKLNRGNRSDPAPGGLRAARCLI